MNSEEQNKKKKLWKKYIIKIIRIMNMSQLADCASILEYNILIKDSYSVKI